jgi:phosphoglycerate dehydrogenase-like enzyme
VPPGVRRWRTRVPRAPRSRRRIGCRSASPIPRTKWRSGSPLARRGIAHIQVRTFSDLEAALPRADVLVVSQMWRNEFVAGAEKLRFIQSISAGIDQYDQALLRARGIRLAHAAGITSEAVAEHAMALILALQRHLHTGRDNQTRKHWRAMISHIPSREDQLGGKTLLIVGLGRIGTRLARLAKAFDMRVVATKRDASRGGEGVDAVYPDAALLGRCRQPTLSR